MHRIRLTLAGPIALVLTGGLLLAAEPDKPEAPKPAAKTSDAKADDKAPIAKPADTRLHPEGEELVDVVGRIESMKLDIRKDEPERSVFRPTDGRGYFILLENSLLQRIQSLSRNGELQVKVSGVVTEYNGRNYLLLRRAAVKRTD